MREAGPARIAAPGVPAVALHTGRAAEVTLAAGLAFGCALIHLQAAIDHVSESRLYAALFVLVALAQAGWAGALLRRPSRRTVLAGIAGSLVMIAAWCASRTVGLPVGPDAAGPEAVGLLDVLATLDEAAIIALMFLAVRPAAGPGVRAGAGAGVLRALALILILFTSLVLAAGVHAH